MPHLAIFSDRYLISHDILAALKGFFPNHRGGFPVTHRGGVYRVTVPVPLTTTQLEIIREKEQNPYAQGHEQVDEVWDNEQ